MMFDLSSFLNPAIVASVVATIISITFNILRDRFKSKRLHRAILKTLAVNIEQDLQLVDRFLNRSDITIRNLRSRLNSYDWEAFKTELYSLDSKTAKALNAYYIEMSELLLQLEHAVMGMDWEALTQPLIDAGHEALNALRSMKARP